jgi:single-strand DNA-binding protein
MSETITVTGNIATEPEQRVVRGDEKVTSFRIAATRRRFDEQTRSWVDVYTNYYSVSAFRALGLNAYTALRKGQRVIVTGRLRVKEWDNGTKQGVTAEIDADGIGHDLLFGVTTFERSGTPTTPPAATAPETPLEPTSESAAPAPAAAPVLVEADAWNVPHAATAGADGVPF